MSEKKSTTGTKGTAPTRSSAKTSAAKSTASKSKPAASSAKKKTGTAAKKTTATQTERQKRLLHRSIRAGVYLFMAFVGVLSLFKVEGFVLNWYKALFGALLGYGYYLTPLCFLAASVMLVARMKHKVRARETAIFCVPVLFGAMGHMLRDISQYPPGLAGIKQLCVTGRELTSGGLISGLLGRLLKSALSAGGGIFLCVLAIVGCIFVATGTNPLEFIKMLRPIPEEEDDEEEKSEPAWMRRRREQQAAKAAAKTAEKEKKSAEPEILNYGYDEALPFDLNGRKKPAKVPETSAAGTTGGKKLTSLGGGFVDFFHKDESDPLPYRPARTPQRRLCPPLRFRTPPCRSPVPNRLSSPIPLASASRRTSPNPSRPSAIPILCPKTICCPLISRVHRSSVPSNRLPRPRRRRGPRRLSMRPSICAAPSVPTASPCLRRTRPLLSSPKTIRPPPN